MSLPPCGVDHESREQFFARDDPGLEMLGVLVLTVIAAIVLGAVGLLAYATSFPILWGVVVIGTAFYLLQLVGQWRENLSGGLFADELHVGVIASDTLARLRRTVCDRSKIGQIQITQSRLTVVAGDGSKLFASSVVSTADMDRFAAFVGGRVIREGPSPARGIAVPAVETPMGVLPLPARRAAGLLLAIGPLLLFIGLINVLIRLPFLKAGQLVMGVELLVGLAVYGALYTWFGFRLARGRRGSRELALIGAGVATVAMLLDILVATGFLPGVAVFAILFVPIYGVIAYWLREPLPSR